MERVYVTGADGLVGSRLIELYSSKYSFLTPTINQLNILDKGALDNFYKSEKPDYVVNFAAVTDVSGAESERDNLEGLCYKVNVIGPENIAEVSRKHKVKYLHISTDYVYSGSKENPGPYSEDSIPESDSNKLTWYGFTKAEGERITRKVLGDETTILRLIYPVRAKFTPKLDYLRKPLSLYRQKKLYPLFSDQQVSISFVDEVAAAVDRIISRGAKGIFHASSTDTTTPYEIVSYLVDKIGGDKREVKASKLSDFQGFKDNLVRYPMYGGLSVEKTQSALGIKYSSWKEIVDKLVAQGIGREE